MNDETITYMGTQWITVDGNSITIGLHEDGLESVDQIDKVTLPDEGETVEADEICAEIETNDGPINIYSPVSGSIVEINSSVTENPSLIMEDSYGDGWLFRVEVADETELSEFISGASAET